MICFYISDDSGPDYAGGWVGLFCSRDGAKGMFYNGEWDLSFGCAGFEKGSA